jgi:hypothetical protein
MRPPQQGGGGCSRYHTLVQLRAKIPAVTRGIGSKASVVVNEPPSGPAANHEATRSFPPVVAAIGN